MKTGRTDPKEGVRRAPAVAALAILTLALAAGPLPAAPVVARITQVTGTPDMRLPGTGVANLDAGNLVAGNTRWDNDGDGIVFNDTHVGFLWSPAGGSRVFRIDDTLYWTPNFHFPAAISDGGTVVGTDLFREAFKGLPFLWSDSAGFNFLPLPCPGPPPDNPGGVSLSDCNGGATDVSADGMVAVGFWREGIFGDFPPMALRWNVMASGRRFRAALHRLDTPDPASSAWAVSADGRVIVGDSGAGDPDLHAVRWVDGVLQVLGTVPGYSTARFTSSDGAVAIGYATVDSRNVLVRWEADGSAGVFAPPAGMSIETIAAINPAATAAVGAISENGNRAPYLWTLTGGFTLLPENGRPLDYDLSEALDVSDDGTAVVGALQSTVISNGDPPPLGFLWTPADGMILLDDLLAGFGFPGAGIFQASAISGDGLRILATGTFPRTDHDTNSLVIELAAP